MDDDGGPRRLPRRLSWPWAWRLRRAPLQGRSCEDVALLAHWQNAGRRERAGRAAGRWRRQRARRWRRRRWRDRRSRSVRAPRRSRFADRDGTAQRPHQRFELSQLDRFQPQGSQFAVARHCCRRTIVVIQHLGERRELPPSMYGARSATFRSDGTL